MIDSATRTTPQLQDRHGGRLFLIFLGSFAIIGAAVLCAIRGISGFHESGDSGSMGFSADLLQTPCSISGTSEFLEVGRTIVHCAFAFTYAQIGLCGAWLAFGGGKWPLRACQTIFAAAALYVTAAVACRGEFTKNLPGAVALLPLLMVSMSAPWLVMRISTARRLSCCEAAGDAKRNIASFSIRDLLLATAAIAMIVTASRMGDRFLERNLIVWFDWHRKQLAMAFGALLAWSVLFELPLAVLMLVIRRTRLAILCAGGWIAAWSALWIVLSFAANPPSDAAAFCGIIGSISMPSVVLFLALRGSGYRLVR